MYRGAFGHHDCVRFAQRPVAAPRRRFTMPIRAFTIPIPAFTMRRSWRSRWTDPRVHDRPSRWCGHPVDLLVGIDTVTFALGDETVLIHARLGESMRE